MTDYEILLATGLDPAEAEVTARCDPLDDKQGLLTGSYRSNPMIVRWWYVDDDEVLAFAVVARNYPVAYSNLSTEDQERLRGETMTASGAEAPVGQAAAALTAAQRAQAPPRPPEVPSLAQAAQELEDDREVDIQPAPCGNPKCFVLVGPDGRQEQHEQGCNVG